MASKMDEDSEEGNKSVVEHFPRKESTKIECVTEEEKDNQGREEISTLSQNAQIVDKVIEIVSDDDSESETFQDAVEVLSLNEKMDSCRTPTNDDEKNGEIKEHKSEDEEEEELTPEEKEVSLIRIASFYCVLLKNYGKFETPASNSGRFLLAPTTQVMVANSSADTWVKKHRVVLTSESCYMYIVVHVHQSIPAVPIPPTG